MNHPGSLIGIDCKATLLSIRKPPLFNKQAVKLLWATRLASPAEVGSRVRANSSLAPEGGGHCRGFRESALIGVQV